MLCGRCGTRIYGKQTTRLRDTASGWGPWRSAKNCDR